MNNQNAETLYTARWVFPIERPPIRDGFVRIARGQIVEVGKADEEVRSSTTVNDLGDVAVLPRWVNAHTHLEFSDCRQPIGQPGIKLADWIGQVVRTRGRATMATRQECIRSGIEESRSAGVGLIGEITTTPCTYPLSDPIHLISFAEVLGLADERSEERFQSAMAHGDALCSPVGDSMPISPRPSFGISPHAPYSTPLRLVERCVSVAIDQNATIAMHVAESDDERELLESGEGPFAESLRAAGLWREGLFPWQTPKPIETLINVLARAPRAMLIHGNDLTGDEISAASRHSNLSVVYCPRTHAFFQHPEHPVAELLASGVRVALGTDSRASNPDLNLGREVQFLLRRRTDLDPLAVLRMATRSGAVALEGEKSRFGRISPGGGAETLMTIPTAGKRLADVFADLAEGELRCSGLPHGA